MLKTTSPARCWASSGTLDAADGEAHLVGLVVHQLLQRADHRDRGAHRVLAAGERRRAGVTRLAIDLDRVPACALDAGDHADLMAARLELRPLLDVRLDVGGDREAERAARQLRRGGQGFAQRVMERDARGVGEPEAVLEPHVPGEHRRAHRAGREPPAFLVGPGDHVEGPLGVAIPASSSASSASSPASTPKMPSNRPPAGWLSMCEPATTGAASGSRPGRRTNRLAIASTAAGSRAPSPIAAAAAGAHVVAGQRLPADPAAGSCRSRP